MLQPSASAPSSVLRLLEQLPAWQRLSLGLLPAALAYLLLPAGWPALLYLLAVWDVFALFTLLVAAAIILTADVDQLRRLASREDPGRAISLGAVVLLAGTSLLAVGQLLAVGREADPAGALRPEVVVGAVAVLAAWLLVHTLFTLRYAHVFYGSGSSRPVGGLQFPGDEPEPDYLDFAYFAFVIGMTAQTSDVGITSRQMRRLALLHGLVAFGFNTAVVALAINGLAGLL
ncbi:DUF1345 domain-containing protein [Hymenobacter lapidiphilus]|uniref:DUF1345 domain-containing protein n=1 Tax=Hymenobacter sp. CCM 8763 TaxID=2303334 RepID=UPI000E34E3C5|nr:DUF1345 domain-containing protein [Hymenobacter sp. CCM 8763]RFP65427.1 DUF1345 domain-containing protein [Hymenobacter sp. CCM 8763]